MSWKRIATIALTGLLVVACTHQGPRQTAGTLIGGAAGGLAGAQFGSGSGRLAATAAGALLGAWVGSEVGRSMDQVDQMRAEQAHRQALNSGQRISWENPNTGNYGYVMPTRTGTDTQTGQLCREFQTTVVVGGQQQQAYGTACRQADGSWQIVSSR